MLFSFIFHKVPYFGNSRTKLAFIKTLINNLCGLPPLVSSRLFLSLAFHQSSRFVIFTEGGKMPLKIWFTFNVIKLVIELSLGWSYSRVSAWNNPLKIINLSAKTLWLLIKEIFMDWETVFYFDHSWNK